MARDPRVSSVIFLGASCYFCGGVRQSRSARNVNQTVGCEGYRTAVNFDDIASRQRTDMTANELKSQPASVQPHENSWNIWLLRGSLFFSLIATSVFGWLGQPAEMAIAFVTGSVAMAFSSLDKIDRFRGASFELQTIRKDVQRNTEDIDTIRLTAVSFARPILGMFAAGDRISLTQIANTEVEDINMYLNSLGVDQDGLDRANEIRIKILHWDHGQHIEFQCWPPKANRENAIEIIRSLRNDTLLTIAEPDLYRFRLREVGLLDDHTEEAVKDLEFLEKRRRLRRPKEFLQLRTAE